MSPLGACCFYDSMVLCSNHKLNWSGYHGITEDIEQYWTGRAEGYSQVNQDELAGDNKRDWLKELERHIPVEKKESLHILDIGTGPGFFSIILAEAGYRMTAVDYTEAMLMEARKNAGELVDRIQFYRMDAQKLDFPDETVDVIVTRNLTWNLEDPAWAYREWHRVLKQGGILLNYDANWYHHLFDGEKRKAYEEDRANVSVSGLEDHYTCTDIDAMEEIARKVPLSKIMRPQWDMDVLKQISFSTVSVDEKVWEHVWSQVEKINYGSTPMFCVEAVK